MSDVSKLKPGTALSTLFFGYDEIPLDRLGDDESTASLPPSPPSTRAPANDGERRNGTQR